MTEYFNNCNSCCEGNLSVPPFDNYQCPQCDEENKPCETCGPQRPKWPCNCCEKDITCAAQACCSPCWDTCKCMDEILGMKKCADKMKREVNNVNGRVTKIEKDLIDFNDNLSDAIGDLAEKEERDIADVRNYINTSISNDAALEEERRIRAANDNSEKEARIAADSLLLQNITNETNSRVEEDEAIRQLIGQVQASLINYYTKGDTYNKTEVNHILENIRRFQYKVVAQLPTASDDTVGYIYLVPSPNPATQNVKDEYITVLNTDGDPSNYYRWEQIGSTTVDLSPYSTTAQMNQAIQSAVSTEQARAAQKEGELLSEVNLEKSRAQGAEQGLLNSLNNAISGVSINGNTLTFTRINGTSFTIDIPGLWKAVGGTLTPIDETKSVTAAGFYDNTL